MIRCIGRAIVEGRISQLTEIIKFVKYDDTASELLAEFQKQPRSPSDKNAYRK